MDATTSDAGIPAPRSHAETSHTICRLAAAAPGRVWLAAAMTYTTHMRGDLAARARARTADRTAAHRRQRRRHARAGRRRLADVVTCIRTAPTLESAGTLLAANAERHLKPPREMARLFEEAPEAIGETLRFLAGISFSLDELRYDYPHELREGFASEQEALEAFTWAGAAARYPQGIPPSVAQTIRHELRLVAALNYAAYFLTVHDIVRYARSQHILCQGRGSAANSAICFCLGITEVDPTRHDLLFERFISAERDEPPDIDVDFEHERREEVMQYIYRRYGRERAGLDGERHHLPDAFGDPRRRQGLRLLGRFPSRLCRARPGAGNPVRSTRKRRDASASTRTSRGLRWRSRSPANSPAFRAICRSIPAVSSSPARGSTKSPRSPMRPWPSAPRSNGTRTISMRSAF